MSPESDSLITLTEMVPPSLHPHILLYFPFKHTTVFGITLYIHYFVVISAPPLHDREVFLLLLFSAVSSVVTGVHSRCSTSTYGMTELIAPQEFHQEASQADILVPILYINKLRPGDVKKLLQRPSAGK